MTQTEEILDALKKQIRSRGLTYLDVARALDISEASVKRLFSEQSFSLKRIEAICDFLGIAIFDLTKQTRLAEEAQTSVLSVDQEQALAENPLLFLYFYLLNNGWTAKRIERKYQVESTKSTQLLAKLDRLKLVELLPRNKVRCLTARYIAWRPNGPIRKRYESQAITEFVSNLFKSSDDHYSFQFGELSTASMALLKRKLTKVEKEFNDLIDVDLHLPPEEKESVGLFLASRRWVFSVVELLRADGL
ncbi:helix-turn-helix domain-containing protein [Pleionea sediminis]|uniref:helix-turn-helix domain-containing protein n=1 Tax=Pleionea sediminis TaxID=2569479 RepID=UPI001186CAE5|nr:helix-turn-helix transcriptional regulator [Pleionea sediminis]